MTEKEAQRFSAISQDKESGKERKNEKPPSGERIVTKKNLFTCNGQTTTENNSLIWDDREKLLKIICQLA